MKQINVFVSHASEDKDAIARPIADAMGKEFTVWFDEYELHVGDSLRGKIDEGLNRCDFGVVVLSESFFAKKWTQAELDGLLALETKNRRLILPVWHGVDEHQVRKFSPMLAGRLGANSSKGVEQVVIELTRSITASDRTREITAVSSGRKAIQDISKKLGHKEAEREFLGSEVGVRATYDSIAAIQSRLAADAEAANSGDAKPRFVVKRSGPLELQLFAPYRLMLSFYRRRFYVNSVSDATLIAAFSKVGDFGEQPTPIDTLDWKPRFTEDREICWEAEAANERLSVAQVADSILQKLSDLIEAEMNDS